MSFDVHTSVLVGFRLENSDLWNEYPTGRVVCENGHERQDEAWKKCPECGTEFSAERALGPTKRFWDYCQSVGQKPTVVWGDWEDGDGLVNWERASENHSPEDEDEGFNILCIKVLSSGTVPYASSKEVSTDPSTVAEAAAAMEHLREGLGIKAPVRVFLSHFTSC